ncbi:MAG: DNA-binding response regulator [Sphingobacteriia bacterium]|nr:MAG: DNA-binding response regulator [Sphingobacteriia bacterium]
MEAQPKRILIADDEPDILEIIGFNLEQEGYSVITAKDGQEALDKAKQLKPDLIILDNMMPKKSGVEVCTILRAQQGLQQIPILFLTALNDEQSEIQGLEAGADDYLNKPISQKILISRVNALFRRSQVKTDDKSRKISVGNMTIDPESFLVKLDDQELVLAKKEFELLYLLATKPGRVFLRHEILSQVWGNEVIVGDRTIDVHIRKIRQKMGIDCITTVKGVGYKFDI